MEQNKRRPIARVAVLVVIILCAVGSSYMVGRIVERNHVKHVLAGMSASVNEYEDSLEQVSQEMAALE